MYLNYRKKSYLGILKKVFFFKKVRDLAYSADQKFFFLAKEKKESTSKKCKDYSTYGMPLGNKYTDGNGAYRYGYQGQFAEADPETGLNSFELRMYDPAIGRWLSVDPKRQYPSPYKANGNNPVMTTDPDGGCDGPCPESSQSITQVVKDVVDFKTQEIKSFVSGGIEAATDSYNSLVRLTTSEGLNELGNGLLNLATTPSVGAIFYINLNNYIENDLPNKSYFDIQHDLGYLGYKVAESYLVGGSLPIPKSLLGLKSGLGGSKYTSFHSYALKGNLGSFSKPIPTPILGLGKQTDDIGIGLSRNILNPLGRSIAPTQIQNFK